MNGEQSRIIIENLSRSVLRHRPSLRLAVGPFFIHCPLGAFPMSVVPRPRLRIDQVDGVVVVSFTDSKITGEDQIQELGEQLYGLLDDSSKKKILLNFGNVQYCSSTVLGKLVGFKRRLDAAKGKLKFCCIHPDLLVPFKLTGLDRVFEIHAEEQDALDAF